MDKYLFYMIIYIIIINIFAMAVTVVDKLHAIHRNWRVPEATLLCIAALGGSPAMLFTMLMIRHKTKKPKFMIGIPVIIVLQIAAAIILWRVYRG